MPRNDTRTPRKDAWTDSDVVRLTEMWTGGASIRHIVLCLNRSIHAIRRRASMLGLYRPEVYTGERPNLWTATEDALLLAGEKVPGRTKDAVKNRKQWLRKIGVMK